MARLLAHGGSTNSPGPRAAASSHNSSYPRAQTARTRRRPSRAQLEHLESRVLLAAAVVNWNQVYQTIDGFGASTAWMGGTIPSAALQQAFSPVTGAGLTLLRTRIAPNGTTSENLAAQQVGALGVKVWSTPWSPPREWKSNHDNNNGGSLLPAHYQDYANHLANYVEDMTRQGVPLYALSLQNEPNWTADYESCRWTAQQFADFLPFVGQTFAARGITAKIMLPEQLNWDFSLANIIMANATLSQYVGILAAHNYGETANSWKPVTIAGGRPVWETEISSFATGTEMDTAIDTANDIFQALTIGNANAYHYWWLNSNGTSAIMNNWAPTKRLWAMGQYARFVRPGWVRIGSTNDGGGLDITTFKDPASGKFAIVVVNRNTSGTINETFTLNGATALSVTPYVTSAAENMAQYAAINLVNGTSFTATLAAGSIVTFYGTSQGGLPLLPPANLWAVPAHGNLSSQIALSWTDNSSGESSYTVERSTDGTNWSTVTTALPANTISYTDGSRAENTRYYYRVKPTNGDASTYSPVVSTATVLRTPTSVSGSRTATGINLTWNLDSTAATGVSIARSLDGVSWTTIANLTTRATSYSDTIPNYSSTQVYFYRVWNTSGATYSARSSWNTGLTAPTAFNATAITTSSVTFTWTNVAQGASGAWIERRPAGSSTWTTVSHSSLQASTGTYTVTGLAGGTSYAFRLRVSANADSLHSGYTSILNVTTVAPSITPIAWYKADESGGISLTDSSGNSKSGTLTGSYSFVPGIAGNALNLNGGNASLPSGIVSTVGNFTIAAWVRPSALDNWARIFDFGTSTSNYMFLVARAGDSGMPRYAITTGSGEQRINSNTALSLNTWTHIAITQSGSTATLYFNGVAVGSNTEMTLFPSSLGNTNRNYIGKSQFNDPAFRGSVDDFRIYERALSAADVQAIYNNVTPPTVATPASAQPGEVTGTTTALSVLGAYSGGEQNLVYTWSVVGTPPAPVTFATNNSNAAKNTIATFSKAGNYTLSVAIQNPGGLAVMSTVQVTVVSSFATIGPITSGLIAGTDVQLYPADQFGNPIATGDVSWSASAGLISPDGLFTAPLASGPVTITCTAGSTAKYANLTIAAPRAWYRNDTSGSTLPDSSGNNLHGSVTGSFSSTPGILGNALLLSGGNATLPTGLVSSLNDFTLSLWVKLTTRDNWSRIFDFGTGTNVNMFLTPSSGDNYLRFAITTGGAGGEQRITTSTTLETGNWYFVAVTLSGTTGTLYVNGQAVGTNTSMTLKPSSLGTTTQNYLGKSQYAADASLKGAIDDVRIYATAASQSDLAALYSAGIAAAGAAPTDATAAAATSSTAVQLQWSDTTLLEMYYLVERATNSAFTTGLAAFLLPPDSTSYIDNSVAPGATYYYRITALLSGNTPTAPALTSPVIPQVPGDTNGDLVVDAFDLNTLAANWQAQTPDGSTVGDVNLDGKVDAFDLNLVAANWQSGASLMANSTAQPLESPALPLPAPTAVPDRSEPASTLVTPDDPQPLAPPAALVDRRRILAASPVTPASAPIPPIPVVTMPSAATSLPAAANASLSIALASRTPVLLGNPPIPPAQTNAQTTLPAPATKLPPPRRINFLKLPILRLWQVGRR